MLLRGMVRMDMARRLNAHRVLSLALCFLALVGWGAFAYAAGSSASAERRFREELAHLKASQDQLLAERNQQQAVVGDLSQLQAKLASAREELAALADRREQAAAQVAAVQQDRTELTKWLEGRRAKVPQKGSVSSGQAVE
jgi:flagellar motility protein MotE (MotC chaperone)